MVIKQYENKRNGKKYYMFSIYLGLDPITGKERRTTKRGFKTKKEAEQCYYNIMATCSTGINTNAEITLKNVGDVWLKYYKDEVKESSFITMKNQYNKLMLDYGDLLLKNLNYTTLQDIINQQDVETRAKFYFLFLKKIFDYCIFRGLMNHNPMKFVKLKKFDKMQKREDEKYLNKQELKQFLNCCTTLQDKVIYRVLAYTGMRRGELCALTWEDIDFNNNTISINKTLYKKIIQTTKNKSSTRVISVDEKTIKLLERYKKETKKNKGYIFNIDKIYHYINARKNSIVNKNKLKNFNIHSLRHTHCSLLLQSGATIQEVQKRLGHSDIKTTLNIYTHVTRGQQQKSINNFISFIEN